MISGSPPRSRAILLWCVAGSLLVHVIVALVLPRLWQTTAAPPEPRPKEITKIEIVGPVRDPLHKPHPPNAQQVRQLAQQPRATQPVQPQTPPPVPAQTPLPVPRRELAREEPSATPEPTPRATVAPAISRDQAGYAKEVAALNRQNDPRAAAKQAAMAVGGLERTDGPWQQSGLECYHARYYYTYPDGTQENAFIAWPLCYDPSADPWIGGGTPSQIPPPPPWFVLPPGTALPPQEKAVYDAWKRGDYGFH